MADMTDDVVSVACFLLVDAHGAILMQERDSEAPRHADQWSMPGGRVEVGETPEEAAHRELAEETEVVLGAGALELWRSERSRLPDRGVLDHHVFTAAVQLSDDDVVCHEGRQIVFVRPEHVLALDLTDATRHMMTRFLGSPRYEQLAARGRS